MNPNIAAMALIVGFGALGLQHQQLPQGPAASCQVKIDYLSQNAARQRPDPRPTMFSQDEANAYFASGNVKLPAGVQDLHLDLAPENIVGRARVDFDRVRAGHENGNPLLSMFSGVHDVEVNADAAGSEGEAHLHINSASIDGINVPRFALELFARNYIKPKYPNLGLDSRFVMPDRVWSATIAQGKAELTQR